MPSALLITLLLATTTVPEATGPLGDEPAVVDSGITASPKVVDDHAPESRKVPGPAVIDNILLRGAIAGGTGLVVGYGVGIVDTFGVGLTIFNLFDSLRGQPALGVASGVLTLAILVGGIGGVETLLHNVNGGSWSDVAIHVGIVAAVSAVGVIVASAIFLTNPTLTTLTAVPVAAGLGAGVAQMVLVFVDLSASQISEPAEVPVP